MDPTFALCRVDPLPLGSFGRHQYTAEELNEMLPIAYQSDLPQPRGALPSMVVPNITLASVDNLAPSNVTVDADLYLRLQRAKDIFADPRYIASQSPGQSSGGTGRSDINGFEEVGRSIFMSRAAIKLANIDAVFNVTGHETGLVVPRVSGKFTYCDVAAGPGAFTQYIQYRRPDATGWGMTLKGPLDWKLGPDGVDPTRFLPIYGPDPSDNGDLYRHWGFFSDYVLRTQVDGVDLVTADGGFDVDRPEDYSRQEFLTNRLLVCQVLVALATLRNGGSFVCKVFDTVTDFSAQLVYLLSLCFDAVIFFKPASSRPANAERYLVAKGCRSTQDRRPVIDLLSQVNSAYTTARVVTGIFPMSGLPPRFIEWLRSNNMESVDRQIRLVERIEGLLAGRPIEVEQYNLDKARLVWNLPDNVNNKRSLVRI